MKPEAMSNVLHFLRDVITAIDYLIVELKLHVLDSSTSVFGHVGDAVTAITDAALTDIKDIALVNITTWNDAYAKEIQIARDTVYDIMRDEASLVNQAIQIMGVLLDYEKPIVEFYWVLSDVLYESLLRIRWLNLELLGFKDRYKFVAQLDEALFSEMIRQLLLPERLVITRYPSSCDVTVMEVLEYNVDLDKTLKEFKYLIDSSATGKNEGDTVRKLSVLFASNLSELEHYLGSFKTDMEEYIVDVQVCMTEYHQKLISIDQWLVSLNFPTSGQTVAFDVTSELQPFEDARDWFQDLYDAYASNRMTKLQMAELLAGSMKNKAVLALDSLQVSLQRKGSALLSENLSTVQKTLVTYYTKTVEHVMDLAEYFDQHGAQVFDSIKHLSVWRRPLPEGARITGSESPQIIDYELSEKESLRTFDGVDMVVYTDNEAGDDIQALLGAYFDHLFNELDGLDTTLINARADLVSKISVLEEDLKDFAARSVFAETFVVYISIAVCTPALYKSGMAKLYIFYWRSTATITFQHKVSTFVVI